MEIPQDDPTAPYVADPLAHHLQRLHSVMAEHAFGLDRAVASSVIFWAAWRYGEMVDVGAVKFLDHAHREVK